MAFFDTQNRLNAATLRRFGVPVVLGGVSVVGDYSAPQRRQDFGDGMQIAARKPQCTVADGDVPANPVGQTFAADPTSADALAAIGSGAFEVVEAVPDGHGLTVLELQKV